MSLMLEEIDHTLSTLTNMTVMSMGQAVLEFPSNFSYNFRFARFLIKWTEIIDRQTDMFESTFTN